MEISWQMATDDDKFSLGTIQFYSGQHNMAHNSKNQSRQATHVEVTQISHFCTIKLDLTKTVQQNLDWNYKYPKCACHCSLHTLISKEPCQQSPWSFDTSKRSLGTQDRNAKKSQEKVFVYVVRFRCFLRQMSILLPKIKGQVKTFFFVPGYPQGAQGPYFGIPSEIDIKLFCWFSFVSKQKWADLECTQTTHSNYVTQGWEKAIS